MNEPDRPSGLTLTVSLLGNTFRLDCHDRRTFDDVCSWWALCRVGDDGEPNRTIEVSSTDSAVMHLSTVLSVAMAASDDLVLLQGFAVADRYGRVRSFLGGRPTDAGVVLPALAAQGLTYVASGAVGVGADAAVTPMPGPLPAPNGDRAEDDRPVPPRALGLMRAEGALRLHDIVIMAADPDHRGEPVVDVPEPVDALMEVVRRTTHLSDLELPLERIIELVQACRSVRRIRYCRVEDVLDVLDELEDVDSTAPHRLPADVETIPPSRDSAAWALRDMRVRATPHAGGVLVDGDDLVLLYGGNAIHLAGIGLTIWDAAVRACPVEKLVESVVAVHGAHPEAEALVGEAAAALRTARVVAWSPPIGLPEYLREVQAQEPVEKIESAGFALLGSA